ncbi:TetR/AcrR family transcriptional regulator [Falsiroseomonas ponticola]|uniref:TetR/AcrR family transcriptional regulator n=1 Tax=Falsiroseomonas ponticola TaxID=2786951 RepID=UPI0019329369|nr:TetR/AcrR family transcriptional regulator [Roseomonas ponticola]
MIDAPRRRTQEERREETRARLLRATVEALRDQGLTRLTTPDIARRAGVSRGALTYHFASREDLLVCSIAWLLDQATGGLRKLCDAYPAPTMPIEALVDYLWDMMASGLFQVTMEFLPEARHNAPFRERLLPVVREFHAALDASWTRLSAVAGIPAEEAQVSLNATMCLIRGMIAQNVLRNDPAYYAAMLGWWKRQLRGWLGQDAGAAAPLPPPMLPAFGHAEAPRKRLVRDRARGAARGGG